MMQLCFLLYRMQMMCSVYVYVNVQIFECLHQESLISSPTQQYMYNDGTVDSGYQAHALVGTIAKIYALHNEVCYITGVKG